MLTAMSLNTTDTAVVRDGVVWHLSGWAYGLTCHRQGYSDSYKVSGLRHSERSGSSLTRVSFVVWSGPCPHVVGSVSSLGVGISVIEQCLVHFHAYSRHFLIIWTVLNLLAEHFGFRGARGFPDVISLCVSWKLSFFCLRDDKWMLHQCILTNNVINYN